MWAGCTGVGGYGPVEEVRWRNFNKPYKVQGKIGAGRPVRFVAKKLLPLVKGHITVGPLAGALQPAFEA